MTIEVAKVNRPPLIGSCRQLSPSLRKFVWKAPHHRLGILQLVRQFAVSLPAGTKILDVGAGGAPYRELFRHCDYKTADPFRSASAVDFVCPIHDLPVEGESFGAVLCTEVLEHVPDPGAALAELRRVLIPGGYLCMTVPFLLGVHETRDYYRFTRDCLREICVHSGLDILVLTPRFGLPMTLWSFIWLFSLWVVHPGKRVSATARLLRWVGGGGVLALAVASFLPLWLIDRFDRCQDFTVGYALLAQRPPKE